MEGLEPRLSGYCEDVEIYGDNFSWTVSQGQHGGRADKNFFVHDR